MTQRSTYSRPYGFNFRSHVTQRGSAISPPPTLPGSWGSPLTGPYDYSPDSRPQTDLAGALPVSMLWTPQPGPQTIASESDADEILYGGEPGGGKSDWLLGFSLTKHKTVHMFRREATQLTEFATRLKEITAPPDRQPTGRLTGGANPRWTHRDQSITLAGLKDEDDAEKWAGRAADGKAFDELTQFTRVQYLTITGWGRSTVKGQRSQTYASANPPIDEDAVWIVQRWRPWLDPTYPDPAQSGEVRWFANLNDVDTECESGEPFEWLNAASGEYETIYPSSRTFIRARLEDNAFLGDDYRRKIDMLPEPRRTIYKTSNFMAMLQTSHPNQVIPTAWIRAAMARWTPDRPEHPTLRGRLIPKSASALDVAQGGRDRTVRADRYDWWVAPLLVVPGIQTPHARDAADLVADALLEGGYIIVDCDGVGGEVYGLLYDQFENPVANQLGRVRDYRGVKPTLWQDRAKTMEFFNVRAAAWWCMREALDPDHGSVVALPPDPGLLAELAAPRFLIRTRKYLIEDKKDIVSRMGRSPDLADAVVMLFWSGGVNLAALPDSTRIER